MTTKTDRAICRISSGIHGVCLSRDPAQQSSSATTSRDGVHILFTQVQGFPKKDARFSKMKNMPDLLRDDREGKIIDFKYLSNRASSKGNPVGHHNVHILARSAGNAG